MINWEIKLENNDDVILELVTQLLSVENEIKLLNEDKRLLLEEYKDKVDLKAFRAALQIIKIRSKLGDSEVMLEQYMNEVAKKITV